MAVADAGCEVVLAEGGRACGLPPGLDDLEGLLRGELAERGESRGRCLDGISQPVPQFLDRAAGLSGGDGEASVWACGGDCLEAPYEQGMAVAADLFPEGSSLFEGGGLGESPQAGPSEPLLDAVLSKQGGEFGSEPAAALAVRHGSSLERAASSIAKSSSIRRASAPKSTSSSMAASAAV